MMNATSLYVSTFRLVFQNDATQNEQNWTDLYRLMPYLRQSLSCTVCGNLLKEPFTPADTQCQHHVCKGCIGGRKKLKPSCTWCRDYKDYEANTQLRILLQCYKSLCEYIIATPIYQTMCKQRQNANGSNGPPTSLVEFIEEGVQFQDSYKSNAGLSKSAYSILPCVYTPPPPPPTTVKSFPTTNGNSIPSSSPTMKTVLLQQQQIKQTISTSASYSMPPVQIAQFQHASNSIQTQGVPTIPIKTVSNGSAMYSVMYAGNGNKITIKRKTDVEDEMAAAKEKNQTIQNFKMPVPSKTMSPTSTSMNQLSTNKLVNLKQPRRGCRCGNATPTPGKLTCCGQRCPCYVESKSCIDCKCRGCRNPHTIDGYKIRPHIPELDCIDLQQITETSDMVSIGNGSVSLPVDTFHSNNSSSNSQEAIISDNRLNHVLDQSHIKPQIHSNNLPTSFISNNRINSESIVFNSNDMGGGIQVLNVYAAHMPEVSTTVPAILMQEPQIGNNYTSMPSGTTGYINHHQSISQLQSMFNSNTTNIQIEDDDISDECSEGNFDM